MKKPITCFKGIIANNNVRDAHSTEVDLRQQLADLTAQLKVTTSEIGSLGKSMSGLDQSVQNVDARLAAAEARRMQFEQWVVTRLGTGQQPTTIPTNWAKSQEEIYSTLTKGSDPLLGWYKLTDR